MKQRKIIYVDNNSFFANIKEFLRGDNNSSKKLPHQIKYQYNIPDKINFKMALSKDGWITVKSPELPGFITQAENPKELYQMINDAVLTYFDVPKQESSEVFDTIKIEGFGVIKKKKQLQEI